MKPMIVVCLWTLICDCELLAAEPPKSYSLPDDPGAQYTSVPHILADGKLEWIDYIYTADARGLYCADDADFMRCHVAVKGSVLEEDFMLTPAAARK